MKPKPRQWNGTLELVVVMIVVVAFITLLAWFFFMAESPLVAPFEM